MTDVGGEHSSFLATIGTIRKWSTILVKKEKGKKMHFRQKKFITSERQEKKVLLTKYMRQKDQL